MKFEWIMFLWVQLHQISIGLDKDLTPNMEQALCLVYLHWCKCSVDKLGLKFIEQWLVAFLFQTII